ncbi:MAG: PAS domain S-box protein [Planctomycetaceae bacterium]
MSCRKNQTRYSRFQQVQESERRYRRLTEAVTDYIYRVRIEDGHAVETTHGANCVAVTGYTSDDFAENTLLWISIVPAEDRPIVEQQVAQILSGVDAPPIEHRIQRKDGQVRWVLNIASVQHDEQGRLVGYDGLIRDITERRNAEEALADLNATLEQRVQEQTREVRLLAEAMGSLGEGVVITGDGLDWPDPRIVYVNPALCRITGYAAEELIGRTPRMLQGERTDSDTLLELRQALMEGRSHRCELVNYRKDGTAYDAEIFVSPLFDAERRRTNFIGIHRDITERKRAEAALQESDAQTTAILSSLPAHIAVIDRTGKVVAVNPAWEEFARKNDGIPVRCNVGTNYLQVCRDAMGRFADEAPQVAEALQSILEGRLHDFTIEYPCHSSTEKRWFLLQATPLRNGSGGAVVSHTNITARVLAEQSLRDREERLRAILSTASDAIVIIDAQGIIDDVNPATVRMFGYHRSEMIGQNVSMLMPSPYREEHDGYISRYMETGDARIIGKGREVVGRRRDGSVFPVDLAVSEVDHMGLFTGAIRDLSERHKVQEELRREQDLTANIVNTVQSIVLLLNPQGHIIHFNPYMTRLTGWSLEDVQGRNWFEIFVRPADRSDIEILFNQAVAGMSTRGNVSVILTRDGREREIEWYDAPLTDADGKLIGLLCSGQDVTENRQLARHVLNAATEEQRRIGQDLHDSVGQEVAGLTMMADALTRAMNENSAWLDERGIDVPGRAGHVRIVEQLSSGLHNALRQLKAVARGLHPVEVDPLGLHSALHELADLCIPPIGPLYHVVLQPRRSVERAVEWLRISSGRRSN